MGLLPALCLLASSTSQGPTPPELPREFRAVWVATVDNIDWPSRRDLSSTDQQTEFIKILDTAKAMNLNAIILQVRPSADALYSSRLEPWSEYLTGRQGRSPSPFYDPLEFAVREAHRRGLELHCWFNPYRAFHPSMKGPLASRHVSRSSPRIVKKYGSFLWMDPGEQEVQRRSLEVMLDVVKRYDIDGVHLDDYFYPYKEKGPDGKIMDFPDQPSYQKYLDGGGTLGKNDWRRQNVDGFIENLYKGIKQEKKWVKVGISPFGIWRPGYPKGIKAGVDQYADLYADARKWLQNGWCDYISPQLYWPIKQTAQSYPALLQWWNEEDTQGRHVWPGNFTSRTNPAEGNWQASEVVNQIKITREMHSDGNVHFSMKAFLDNWHSIRDVLRKGVYANPALVPASPWLGDKAPGSPKIHVDDLGVHHWSVSWNPSGRDKVRFYSVALRIDGQWQAPKVSDDTSVDISQTIGVPTEISVTSVDLTGNTSLPAIAKLSG